MLFPRIHGMLAGVGGGITDGLWELYNFDNVGNLGEGEVGNLNLTPFNAPTQGVGPSVAIPFSAQFSAPSLQYFEASFPSLLFDLNMAQWSFSLWARVTNTAQAGTETMLGFVNLPSTIRAQLASYITATNSQLIINSTPTAGYNLNVPVPSSFHHFVGTKNGNLIRYYVDGVQATGIGFDTVGVITQTNLVMRVFRGTTLYATGNLSQLAIWENRTLELVDVQELYNGGAGIVITP